MPVSRRMHLVGLVVLYTPSCLHIIEFRGSVVSIILDGTSFLLFSTHDSQCIHYFSHIFVMWNRRLIDWMDESCFRWCSRSLIAVQIAVTSSENVLSRSKSGLLSTFIVRQLCRLTTSSTSPALVAFLHQFPSSFQTLLYLLFSCRLPST